MQALVSQGSADSRASAARKPAAYAANTSARRLHTLLALVVVGLPTIATAAALVLALGYGVGFGPVEAALVVVFYALTIVGIGCGYHRLFSHQSYKTTTPVRVVLAILGSMAAQGPVLFWSAIHRRHHTFADTEGDTHSPYVHRDKPLNRVVGLWHAHTGWLFDTEVTDWGSYVPDLLKDDALFRVQQLYFLWIALGLAIPAAVGGLAHQSLAGAGYGLLWGGLVRTFMVHHSTWAINSVCHVFGRRPFKIRDQARNNWFVAILTFGEGWHNNHHAFPYSAPHSLRWWQYDPNGWVIASLRAFGLAWDVRSPSAEAVQEKLGQVEPVPVPADSRA